LVGVAWLPLAVFTLVFGGDTFLLAISEVAMFALPATMLAWILCSKRHIPHVGSIVIVDAAYVIISAYHGAIGWLTLPGAPITPWLIGYHCLALVSLAVASFFLLSQKHSGASN
jgi:nitric oxide synthase oxygenase domain/subunit